jgi:hypothetical protein
MGEEKRSAFVEVGLGVHTEMIYLFEMERRFTEINHGLYRKLVEVDGIGIFVGHNNPDELKPEIIRRHLFGVMGQAGWVQAPNPESFKEYFQWFYEGARVGTKHPAEWVKKEHPILEVPDCGNIYVKRDLWREEFRCELTEYPCVLNYLHWDEEDAYCPVKQVSDVYHNATDLYNQSGSRFNIALAKLGFGRYSLKEEVIDGFKFIRQVEKLEPLPLFEYGNVQS